VPDYHGRNAWELLRASRCDPPGAASQHDHRRRTYVFALEQAEQMFRAAAAVGTATRPLLVFYGLSQAGRAIAAASVRFANGDDWQLRGHGIKAVGDSLVKKLEYVRLCTGNPGDHGSFVLLSELLGSPLWGRSRFGTLMEIWDYLPENRASPLRDRVGRKTPLYVEHWNMSADPHPLASVPVLYFPPHLVHRFRQKQFEDYLMAFPGAKDYDSYVRVTSEDYAEPQFSVHADGWGELVMNWMVPRGGPASLVERTDFLKAKAQLYDGSLYFFPAFGETGRSLHPLMAWWAVLFALSMLARYQPAEWAAHTDVDQAATPSRWKAYSGTPSTSSRDL
jgi:hypothetical protein